jgi:hypothetical protein
LQSGSWQSGDRHGILAPQRRFVQTDKYDSVARALALVDRFSRILTDADDLAFCNARLNVTYLVGTDTVDDFVQVVLDTKGALVNAVVEGGAMAGDLSGSVLDELQRALRAISPDLADAPRRIEDDDVVERLLRDASEKLRTTGRSVTGAAAPVRRPEEIDALRRALEALSRVLSGPSVTRYRIASSSQPGVEYVITAGDADVECSCPGFEYRGQCRHARDVKAALAAGRPVPPAYVGEAGAQA